MIEDILEYRDVIGTSPAPQERYTSVIRDGLYDRIPMIAPAIALISTLPFLRLDRIQQLGFVSRVWPGAKHTRYEHSLGVMHLTRLAVEHLCSTPEGTWITPEDARTVVAAALLHDIGHYPFSHAIEEIGAPVATHEAVGQVIIESGEIAEILSQDWLVDPARVAGIIHDDRSLLNEADLVLGGLLSGTLDMDKLDYLPRDARACNVPYGGVDTARLIESLTIVEVDLPGTRTSQRIAITEKGISPLHSLINARQEMFDNVYWHHTNRACMVMLLRAIQDALLADAISPGSLTGHDDASLLAFMRSVDMPAATRRLADALAGRRIHKRAVEISARAESLYSRLAQLWYDQRARREVELRLVAALSNTLGEPVEDTAILIDIPKPEKWKTDVWVSFRQPPVGMQPLMHWQDVVGLGDEDFKRYEEHRRMIRIVTEEPYRHVLAETWEALLYPALGGAL
ncbi:MAG TPA: HD domain-containing protein [Thermomicrobiales bacterium]|nr:HD domain-containing protein [Thermomicrobiales bacterium]